MGMLLLLAGGTGEGEIDRFRAGGVFQTAGVGTVDRSRVLELETAETPAHIHGGHNTEPRPSTAIIYICRRFDTRTSRCRTPLFASC